MKGSLVPVLTIDGPSGTGKGTLARLMTRWLGWNLLDSGALYRLLALRVSKGQREYNDEKSIAALAAGLEANFIDVNGETRVEGDGADVTHELRTEEVAALASRLASLISVRQALLERQHAFCQPPGLVADGRDMGTVVFPKANLKIYLTASLEERAQRRYNQLKGKGMNVNLARLRGDIAERDQRDEKREMSPLEPATDAIILDTTRLKISAVEERVKRLVHKTGLI